MLGQAQNARLNRELEAELAQAKQQWEQTQEAARVFKDFSYQTLESWSRPRRVVGKAEHLEKGPNPRFVVTSFSAERFTAQTLYEEEYCTRGEMENQIKEQQLCLFADRTSAATMRANELRLWFSSTSYVLILISFQDDTKSDMLQACHDNAYPILSLRLARREPLPQRVRLKSCVRLSPFCCRHCWGSAWSRLRPCLA